MGKVPTEHSSPKPLFSLTYLTDLLSCITSFYLDVAYHSNRNVYQTNSLEFEVGNGKNYQCPKKSFWVLSRSFWRETWHCSADIQGPMSANFPELPIRNSEEFEVGNGKNLPASWIPLKCPLQTQFWRPQRVGFVWSVPASCKENDIAWTKGGGKFHHKRRGPRPFFGGRALWYVFPSPEFRI